MEIKNGAGILLAPKILFEKVLTNVSRCAIIKAQKTKGAKNMKTICDNVAAEELFLYAINSSTIYACSIKPLIANYRKKIAKNQYDNEKAIKGFENIAKMILEYFENEIWEC